MKLSVLLKIAYVANESQERIDTDFTPFIYFFVCLFFFYLLTSTCSQGDNARKVVVLLHGHGR